MFNAVEARAAVDAHERAQLDWTRVHSICDRVQSEARQGRSHISVGGFLNGYEVRQLRSLGYRIQMNDASTTISW